MNTSFVIPRALFPVEHRFVDLDGARIHYVDEGAGEPLLLLHGNPSWSFVYRKIIVALRDDFRCIALDFPGYGLSEAPPGYGFTPQEHSRVLERFVDALGLKELALMVQDWGGPIGLGFAGRRPELVRSLIIGNTFAWPLSSQRRFRVFSWLMGGPVGRSLTTACNLSRDSFSCAASRVVCRPRCSTCILHLSAIELAARIRSSRRGSWSPRPLTCSRLRPTWPTSPSGRH